MGWTVQGSNPGGSEIFRTRPDRPCRPPSLLYNEYRVPFPEVKRPERGFDHPPHQKQRLNKEYSYASTLPAPWATMACYWVKFTFTFTF